MTGSEFEFRYAWIISNLNLKNLNQSIPEYTFHFIEFYPCTVDNLKLVYSRKYPYNK